MQKYGPYPRHLATTFLISRLAAINGGSILMPVPILALRNRRLTPETKRWPFSIFGAGTGNPFLLPNTGLARLTQVQLRRPWPLWNFRAALPIFARWSRAAEHWPIRRRRSASVVPALPLSCAFNIWPDFIAGESAGMNGWRAGSSCGMKPEGDSQNDPSSPKATLWNPVNHPALVTGSFGLRPLSFWVLIGNRPMRPG